MAKLVSKTYGDALFELAVESGQMDGMLEEARLISQILREDNELSKLMNHPKIVNEEKIGILEQVFKGRVHDEITGLMRMLVSKGHYGEMESVFAYFIDQVKEYQNIGTVYVTAPMPLSDSQKEQVKKKLLETTKYVEFEMHYDVDESLIGGMVIRIGDRVIDSSVKSRLMTLTRELSKIQLKVGE
ncbi:MAG: ATP synthase F1 subunit delta [Lachnospiraceae bacterium]|nr:ATP synthase F1 subunit delta [Lachnospiraceae bacterium]